MESNEKIMKTMKSNKKQWWRNIKHIKKSKGKQWKDKEKQWKAIKTNEKHIKNTKKKEWKAKRR